MALGTLDLSGNNLLSTIPVGFNRETFPDLRKLNSALN